VRGWSNYYRVAHDYSKSANWLDHQALWIAVKALCCKFDISTAECLRKYERGRNQISITDKYMLRRAQDIPMSWRHEAPAPYKPGTGCYLDDADWEAVIRQYEQQRPGCMELRGVRLPGLHHLTRRTPFGAAVSSAFTHRRALN
jgi:hypothetical protein